MKGIITFKGGPGSGHFGHSGRPGKVGGSGFGGGSGGLDRVWNTDNGWTVSGNETVGGYLERHNIPVNDDGTVTLYHGRPKDSKYTTLRKGSYIIDDPEKAAFFAYRDREGMGPDDVEVLKLRLNPDDIEPGMFITLRNEVDV